MRTCLTPLIDEKQYVAATAVLANCLVADNRNIGLTSAEAAQEATRSQAASTVTTSAELAASGQFIAFTAVAANGIGRASLYRNTAVCAVIDEQLHHAAGITTLAGLAADIAALRTALEAVSARVRNHEEQLCQIKRATTLMMSSSNSPAGRGPIWPRRRWANGLVSPGTPSACVYMARSE
jgi:hypothetical protein